MPLRIMKNYLPFIVLCLIGCSASEQGVVETSSQPNDVTTNDSSLPKVGDSPLSKQSAAGTTNDTLIQTQTYRLFEGEWYANWIESAKYQKNSDNVSELGHFFDDNVNPYYESFVTFYDYGYTWSVKPKITSEPQKQRIKLNQNGPVEWSQHVDMINNDRIAIRRNNLWIVCDHWATKSR